MTLSPSTTAIRSLTGDYDIIIPNAIQVRVHGGYYSMFVDSKQEADLLVTALRKAAGIAIWALRHISVEGEEEIRNSLALLTIVLERYVAFTTATTRN